jgi:hypothetical protein
MCDKGKGEKPLSLRELHSPMQWLQWYLEMYHGLQCTHSYMNNVTNGYANHPWYDYTGIMKNAQLYDVVY